MNTPLTGPTPRDRELIALFARRVRERFPAARIWAFGSRARGDAAADSDLDMCVVLPQLDFKLRTEIGEIAWEVGFEHDVLITTIVFDTDRFEHDPWQDDPLVRNIRREGLAA